MADDFVYLYKLKDRTDIVVSSLEDAKNYSIVTQRDSMIHHWLSNREFPKILLVGMRDYAVRTFINGRSDLLAFNERDTETELIYYGVDPGRVQKLLRLFDTPSYMALSTSTSDKVLLQLQNSFDELLKSKSIKLIDKQFIDIDY